MKKNIIILFVVSAMMLTFIGCQASVDKQEYQLKENDEILLTTQGRLDNFYCMPMNVFEKFESVKQKYVELFLNVEGKQEVTIETEIADKRRYLRS